jgi:hypothetical protein
MAEFKVPSEYLPERTDGNRPEQSATRLEMVLSAGFVSVRRKGQRKAAL